MKILKMVVDAVAIVIILSAVMIVPSLKADVSITTIKRLPTASRRGFFKGCAYVPCPVKRLQ